MKCTVFFTDERNIKNNLFYFQKTTITKNIDNEEKAIECQNNIVMKVKIHEP